MVAGVWQRRIIDFMTHIYFINRVRKMRPETKYTLQSHVPGNPTSCCGFDEECPPQLHVFELCSTLGQLRNFSEVEPLVSHWGSFLRVIASPQFVFPPSVSCKWVNCGQPAFSSCDHAFSWLCLLCNDGFYPSAAVSQKKPFLP